MTLVRISFLFFEEFLFFEKLLLQTRYREM